VAVPHLSVAERVARGKAARAEVPRSSHAVFEPPPTRDDPIELLERQAQTRVPELVPIRYGRMMVSPFTFYRGAAMIMAHDLALTPRSGLTVQCCGDAHLSNFGVFASPERRLVFDLNDFDETLPGPWEWDVKRLAVSMLIAARDNGYRTKDQERIVLDAVGRYRTAIADFAAMKNLWPAPGFRSTTSERVVVGQRLMQATSDIFLGWLHIDSGLDNQPRDFYGRQLKDWKGSAEIEQMAPKAMATYGKLCGWTLARAHARSGDRIAIAAYLGNGDSFDRAILEFSNAYADQNDRDYRRLAAAVGSGELAAQTGL